MKVITTSIHGLMDYIGGVALLLAPEIFNFTEFGGAAVAIPRILGMAVLLQAVLTKYELGIFKVLSMRTHLINDYVAGAFLAVSPWLFGFSNLPMNAWMPHLVAGLVILGFAFITEPFPRVSHTGHHRV